MISLIQFIYMLMMMMIMGFIEYSNKKQNVYKNIDEYNAGMVQKRLSVFEDIIADMFINKKSNPVVTEIFIRGRKLNISISFITQSYLAVPKDL